MLFNQLIRSIFAKGRQSWPAKNPVRYHFHAHTVRNFHLLPQRPLAKLWSSASTHRFLKSQAFGRLPQTNRY